MADRGPSTPVSPSVSPTVDIVSGGGRGIGRAVALALGAMGHAVCVDDTGVAVDGTRNDTPEEGTTQLGPAGAVAAEIRSGGGQALASTVDARSRPEAERLVAEVTAWAGSRPTVLVHAAGILRDRMVHRSSDDDWAEVLGTHLGVAVELTRAMAAAIREERTGRIVYVGGAAGLVGSVGQAAYAVAKAGLFGLTRAVALEMAGRDVCVNYVAPFAFTRMTETIPPATDQLREYLRQAPLTPPDDVAPLIAWLCSPAAAGVSGQVFGARGAELAVWSQPRPVATSRRLAGWDVEAVGEAVARDLAPHLTPLESEFDLFGGPPVAVTRGAAGSVAPGGTSP